MIVEEIMKTDVITLSPNDSLKSAITLMRDKKIRHIPITNERNELLGLITERDFKDIPHTLYLNDEEDKRFRLSDFMKTSIITGHPLDFVEEVAALFYEHRIGCLPILRDKKLVGIITSTDLLHTMVQLTGANQPGSQIEVKVPNRKGILYEVTGIFRMHNVNIHSVLVYPDKKDLTSKIIVFRIGTMNPIAIIESLKENGHQVLWPNLPGV
ncbi:acetoin utilization AcuB family protein [Bacillus sp. FJAT-49736]|uniref:acetoin utilization AcuB family protein n=1 Tax=Bacillus sp. FJAT-49736 TaxID=2833582 RepID=UPI001BC96EF0|nr:acetoin utilization AcuB family protein [Bacillus sp. FJAT-49736]MBS4173842.1 acetoin utilization AcuB family protein [Bacillus sp. FJAT-49736]